MSASAKTKFTDKFQEFIADEENRRVYERESLAFDAAEMISHLMEEQNVSKAQLARRIGKSRSEVTQLLNGSRNLTVYSLADLAFALGYRLEFKARQHRSAPEAEQKTHALYRFAKRSRQCYLPPDQVHLGKKVKSSSIGA